MKKIEHTPLLLTHSSLLMRNMLYNLLGFLAPMIAAVAIIPLLISRFGEARFGVLAIAWMVLGYFGLFDLGLGRVLTKLIGEKLGANKEGEVVELLATGLLYMAFLGIISMIIVYLISPILVYQILKIPPNLQIESVRSFRFLAFSIPFVTLTVGLRGVMQAYQKFGFINIVRTINGLYVFLAPFVVSIYSVDLYDVMIFLLLGRLVLFIVYMAIALHLFPALVHFPIRLSLTGQMFRLGGWMTVSNIIGPVMVYFDRFLIGAWISIAAVSYYVTPYEVVTKLIFFATAIVTVLFPAFSTTFFVDPHKTARLYSQGIRIILIFLLPLTLLILTFAKDGLDIWVGSEFASVGTPIMQWLALGVLWNAVAQVALALLHAAGRPNWTAKLHLAESPLYLLILFAFIKHFGVQGAAIAWTLRVLIDTIIMLVLAKKAIKVDVPNMKMMFPLLFYSLAITVVFVHISQLKVLFLIINILLYVFLLWRFLLSDEEKRVSLGKIFVLKNLIKLEKPL